MISGKQAQRGEALWKALEGQARVERADGATRREADLELNVSPPLPHGVDGTPFGSVVALTVVDPAERERFVFASDLQGPASVVAAAYLIRQRPTLLYVSGPVSYLERALGPDAIDCTLRTFGLKEVGLAEFRGKNVVILFYPLDWTPG